VDIPASFLRMSSKDDDYTALEDGARKYAKLKEVSEGIDDPHFLMVLDNGDLHAFENVTETDDMDSLKTLLMLGCYAASGMISESEGYEASCAWLAQLVANCLT